MQSHLPGHTCHATNTVVDVEAACEAHAIAVQYIYIYIYMYIPVVVEAACEVT